MSREFEQAECVGDCAIKKMQNNEREQAIAQKGFKGGSKRRRRTTKKRSNRRKHKRRTTRRKRMRTKKHMKRNRRKHHKKGTKKYHKKYYGGSQCLNCARVEASGGKQAMDAVKASEDLAIQAKHNNRNNKFA